MVELLLILSVKVKKKTQKSTKYTVDFYNNKIYIIGTFNLKGNFVLFCKVKPDVSCNDFSDLYRNSRSLQVGVPKYNERRENCCLLPENSQQLGRASENGDLREFEPESAWRWFVCWGCAVGAVLLRERARVRSPGKPNSHRLLAELRLTELACWASAYVLVSAWTLTGRGKAWKLSQSLPTIYCVISSGCGVFWDVYHAGKLVASADRSLVRPSTRIPCL